MSAIFRSLPARASAVFRGFRSRTPPLLPSSFSSSHLATTIQRLPFSSQDTTNQRLLSQTEPALVAVDSIQMVKKLEDHGIARNEADAILSCCTVGTLKDDYDGIFIKSVLKQLDKKLEKQHELWSAMASQQISGQKSLQTWMWETLIRWVDLESALLDQQHKMCSMLTTMERRETHTQNLQSSAIKFDQDLLLKEQRYMVKQLMDIKSTLSVIKTFAEDSRSSAVESDRYFEEQKYMVNQLMI